MDPTRRQELHLARRQGLASPGPAGPTWPRPGTSRCQMAAPGEPATEPAPPLGAEATRSTSRSRASNPTDKGFSPMTHCGPLRARQLGQISAGSPSRASRRRCGRRSSLPVIITGRGFPPATNPPRRSRHCNPRADRPLVMSLRRRQRESARSRPGVGGPNTRRPSGPMTSSSHTGRTPGRDRGRRRCGPGSDEGVD